MAACRESCVQPVTDLRFGVALRRFAISLDANTRKIGQCVRLLCETGRLVFVNLPIMKTASIGAKYDAGYRQGNAKVKRLLDIALAISVGFLFFPVIILTAAMVFVSLGLPLLFVQHRAGHGGETFPLYKWRSMSNAIDANGELLPDNQRVTRIGLLVRRLRVDELPSLLNILRGDLSFVGPRPLPSAAPINQMLGQARLAVRPGLTGLSQVSGNTLLSNQEKLAVDLYYIGHHSPPGDLLIVWKTLVTVLKGELRNEPLIRHALKEMEEMV